MRTIRSIWRDLETETEMLAALGLVSNGTNLDTRNCCRDRILKLRNLLGVQLSIAFDESHFVTHPCPHTTGEKI